MKFGLTPGHMVRLGFAGVVLIVAVWQLAPLTLSNIRSNGVVNARLVTMQAPISGQLVRALPNVGEQVISGQAVTRIIDDTEPRALLAQLDSENQLLRSRAEALQEKLDAMTAIRAELEERVSDMISSSQENLHFRLIELEARQKSWEAVVRERRLALDRSQALLADGHVTRVRVEENQSLLEQAEQEVLRAKADSERLRRESESIGRGVFVGDGQNDVPYSRQRLDEVVLSVADLKVQLAETRGRMAAVERQFREEAERAGRRESTLVRSPLDGIVWRRIAAELSTVTRNDDLAKVLDCSQIFVEVPVDEGMADKLSTGSSVEIRLQGAQSTYQGIVAGIRGTRAVSPDIEFAALPPLLKKDEVLLVIDIPDSGFDQQIGTFCNVGRRVEVQIPSRLSGLFGSEEDEG
ncbi:HlyD family secretion protein [Thalassospira australica]|uniref:HlyD family secretion protein n=1 Tax=Thalassospira australica TaxID=1528106 RepID=UPI00385002AE